MLLERAGLRTAKVSAPGKASPNPPQRNPDALVRDDASPDFFFQMVHLLDVRWAEHSELTFRPSPLWGVAASLGGYILCPHTAARGRGSVERFLPK